MHVSLDRLPGEPERIGAVAGGLSIQPECACGKVSIHDVVYRYHEPLIKFLRRRLRVPEDADDIAQETYIRMMKYEGARDIRSPGSMLFRIAVNVANDLGRSAQVKHAAEHIRLEDAELVSAEPSAERVMTASQNLEMLYAAIEQLPPKCRQVFLLSRVRGMTYAEIAEHCGISVKMVEKHISRALVICLEKVGEGV